MFFEYGNKKIINFCAIVINAIKINHIDFPQMRRPSSSMWSGLAGP